MKNLLLIRIGFGLATFCFALAAVPGTLTAGIAHCAATLLCLGVVFHAGAQRDILVALRTPQLWIMAALLACINAGMASATALAELTTLACLSQSAQLWAVGMAPLWGERPSKSDIIGMLIALIGICVVIGVSLDGQALGIAIALLAAAGTAVWTHMLGSQGRKTDTIHPAAWISVMMGLTSSPRLKPGDSSANP